MAFENITKGKFISNSGLISTKIESAHNISIKAILIPSSGIGNYDIENANAEFVSYCFNLQQKMDIGCYEDVVSMLNSIYHGSGMIDTVKMLEIGELLIKAKRL